MNLTAIRSAAREILKLANCYSSKDLKEMALDPLVLGFFHGKYGKMSRQHRVWISNSTHPKRIDFRYGSSNPVVLEFAMRPRSGASELYGPCNGDELRKLTRVRSNSARLRVLLLLDLFRGSAISKQSLVASYSGVNSGRGRFKRHPVRVVYAHWKGTSYDFIWSS
jgi:hypothetical protein